MGLIGKFKSLLEPGTSGKLDVDGRYDMLRNSISGTMSQFRMARDKKTDQIVGLKILDDEKTEYFESRFRGLDKPSEGEIVSVGAGARDDDGERIAMDVKAGDKILFGKWSGTEITIDGEELLIMKESDILGVVA